MIANPLQELTTRLSSFTHLPVGGEFKLGALLPLIRKIAPEIGAEEILSLHGVVTDIHAEIRNRAGKATVGDILGHPRLRAFFDEYAKTPLWRLLRCPHCRRVVERDITNPGLCTCGYDWSSERERLQAEADRLKPKGILEHFKDAQKG